MRQESIKNLVIRNRSYRRFCQKARISRTVLRKLIELARMSASAGNNQPLKYYISNQQKENKLIFSCLSWAGYLTNWSGPAPGEQPSAYIIILGDTSISRNFWCDHGIAAQSIMLGAVEAGLGGCMLGAINHKRLRTLLQIPKKYEILLVLAIGKPKERVVLETVKGNDIKYWRDSRKTHHVPKRSLKNIIIN